MKVEHGHPATHISTILQICFALGIQITIKSWKESDEADNEWQ
jgi:DNA-binding phage protein